MTSFLGAAMPQQRMERDNKQLWTQWHDESEFWWVPLTEAWTLDRYRSPWWPRGQGFLGDQAVDYGMLGIHVSWNRPELYSGAVAKMAIIGVTRDVNGSVLGGCVVKLFKTVGGGNPDMKDVKLDETTSDATTGAFTLMTPFFPDTHYIVSYKAGSPDVEGTTVNTLIGA